MRSHRDEETSSKEENLTPLVAPKSFNKAGLITSEEKSSTFLFLFSFLWFQLRSKLNAASHDSIAISTKDVVPRVSFPDMRSKWTEKLFVVYVELEVIASDQQMNLSMFVQRGLVRTMVTLLILACLSRGPGL